MRDYEQMSLFEDIYPLFKIKKPIRLIELFGGIGSQAKALENLGADFSHHKLVEIDKYAVNSYNAVHGTDFKPCDIKSVTGASLEVRERERYCYIMTYSFPCVDISNAGRMAGFKKESGTRSGLLWEVERLLNECGDDLPQVLLMENVPNVICDRNVTDFGKWVSFLEGKGYSNYIEIINAKDVGYPSPIPQRRERCFMVSILGEYLYYFPKKQPLKATLKDLLEDDVAEKYLLSKSMLKHIVSADDKYKVNPNNLVVNRKIACTKTTREGYTRADCSDFIATKDDRDNIPLGSLFVKEATAKGYAEAELGDSVDLGFPKSSTRRGRVGKQIAQTLMTSCDQGVVVEYLGKLGLRKLTPRECWRLMGFSDDDYDKASKVTSECQLYKQAGNSIVVNVLSAIFKEML